MPGARRRRAARIRSSSPAPPWPPALRLHAGSAGGTTSVGAPDRPGLGAAARVVADRARTIVRLELELAAAELRRKALSVGVGIALLVVGAALALLGLGFAFATTAAAIATALPVWAALLIVTALLLGLAGLLAALGVAAIKRGTPPVPEQAIAEAKLTTEALRRNGDR